MGASALTSPHSHRPPRTDDAACEYIQTLYLPITSTHTHHTSPHYDAKHMYNHNQTRVAERRSSPSWVSRGAVLRRTIFSLRAQPPPPPFLHRSRRGLAAMLPTRSTR